jgi:hypothetical protein
VLWHLLVACCQPRAANPGAVVEQGLAMKPILLGVAKEMKLKNKRAALDYDRELRASALANDMTVPQYRAYLEEQYGDED